MEHTLKCIKCGSYGFEEKCNCGGKRETPKPPKFSPEDKYAEYRRRAKNEHQNIKTN